MKTAQIIAVSAMLCLVGCAHQKEEHFTPPSSVEVQRNVAKVKEYVKPEGKQAYIDLEKSITNYQEQVEKQTQELAKAQNEAIYWHDKQVKALKELWTWRLIALSAILCVVVYIGIKTSWRFLL
jgi:hypothetical protein